MTKPEHGPAPAVLVATPSDADVAWHPVDMSSAAIERRLATVSALRDLMRSLATARPARRRTSE